MHDIISEVKVIFCKRTADIIFLVPSLGDKLLILRNDYVIAALFIDSRAQTVVYFFSAVERENDVRHLAVDKVNAVIVEQNTVCSHCETEVLIVLFLDRSCILDNFFNNIEIHERLAAEEIKFEVVSVCGMFDKEIYRSLADLERHELSAVAEIALSGKAILTAEIAVVRYVEAHRLYRRLSEHICKGSVGILGEKRIVITQSLEFGISVDDILLIKPLVHKS